MWDEVDFTTPLLVKILAVILVAAILAFWTAAIVAPGLPIVAPMVEQLREDDKEQMRQDLREREASRERLNDAAHR